MYLWRWQGSRTKGSGRLWQSNYSTFTTNINHTQLQRESRAWTMRRAAKMRRQAIDTRRRMIGGVIRGAGEHVLSSQGTRHKGACYSSQTSAGHCTVRIQIERRSTTVENNGDDGDNGNATDEDSERRDAARKTQAESNDVQRTRTHTRT